MRVLENIFKDIKRGWPALAALAVYCTVTQLLFGTVCPVALATGYPCPGCGLTRSFALLVTFRWADALAFHACIVLWVGLGVYVFFRRYVFEKKGFPLAVFLAVCAVTVVYYVWRMVNYYPSQAPLIYREKNLLGIIVAAVGNLIK